MSHMFAPFVSDGYHFALGDGNKWLKPFGKQLFEAPIGADVPPDQLIGKYIVHFKEASHFVAVRVHAESLDILDDGHCDQFPIVVKDAGVAIEKAFPSTCVWYKLTCNSQACNRNHMDRLGWGTGAVGKCCTRRSTIIQDVCARVCNTSGKLVGNGGKASAYS